MTRTGLLAPKLPLLGLIGLGTSNTALSGARGRLRPGQKLGAERYTTPRLSTTSRLGGFSVPGTTPSLPALAARATTAKTPSALPALSAPSSPPHSTFASISISRLVHTTAMTKDPTPKPERLSTKWRREREEQVRDVAAGTFPADEAFLAELFPDAFLDPLDELLVAYEKDVTAAIASNGRGPQAFCALYAAVEKLVLALNDLNENGDGCYIETGEREALCEYMELIIEHEGLSIEEMGKDLGFGMGELTDEWRDW